MKKDWKAIAGLVMLVAIAMCITDCWSGRDLVETAKVLETKYVEPWTSVTSHSDDKGGTRIETTYHPGYWNVWVRTNAGAEYRIESDRGEFGDRAVIVSTRVGRWSGVAWLRNVKERP